jgi:Rod binding domain-containing protein
MQPIALDPTLANMSVRGLSATPRMSASPTAESRAREQSQDFEAVFLSTMFQSMFTGVSGDGPMGSTTGVAPWRSFLTQEYGKAFVKAGGVGLADHVYRSLIEQQAARTK